MALTTMSSPISVCSTVSSSSRVTLRCLVNNFMVSLACARSFLLRTLLLLPARRLASREARLCSPVPLPACLVEEEAESLCFFAPPRRVVSCSSRGSFRRHNGCGALTLRRDDSPRQRRPLPRVSARCRLAGEQDVGVDPVPLPREFRASFLCSHSLPIPPSFLLFVDRTLSPICSPWSVSR